MRFPCFLVVTLHHRCQLTSLEKTVARELSSSDGKEEGRENTYRQLLHGSGNRVRARSWRAGLEKQEVTAGSPCRPINLAIWVPSFMSHTAFRWSRCQGIGLDCVTFTFAAVHLLLNSLGDPPTHPPNRCRWFAWHQRFQWRWLSVRATDYRFPGFLS